MLPNERRSHSPTVDVRRNGQPEVVVSFKLRRLLELAAHMMEIKVHDCRYFYARSTESSDRVLCMSQHGKLTEAYEVLRNSGYVVKIGRFPLLGGDPFVDIDGLQLTTEQVLDLASITRKQLGTSPEQL